MKQFYYLRVIILFIFCYRSSVTGQTTLGIQDFESTPATPTWTIAAGAGNISTTAGAGDTPASQRIRNGSRSWQVNNGTATLELNSISVSGYTGVTVYVRISSTSATAGNGADVADYLRTFVSLNGAAFPANTQANADIAVNGNSNSRWSYNAAENATTNAGTNLVVAGTSGTNTGTIYSTLRINIPDGTNTVALRVIALNNDANEIWNVDDITVVSTSCSSAPTTQATNISFSSITATSMTVGWNSGNGARRILVGRQGSPVSWTPTNGVAPSGVSANFASATDQGSGNKILYNFTGNSVNITNLSANTVYYFRVYEFCDATNQYLTSAGTNNDGTQNQQTNCNAEPTTQASNISFGTTGPTSMVINWTNGNGRQRIVVVRASASVSWTPTDGTAPSGVNSNYTSATDKGSGNKIVYSGTGSTVTITGLTASTTYYVQVFEFCNSTNDYLITPVPTNNGTQSNTTSASAGPTTLYMGDLALVALDANYTYSGDNTCDKICFVNFVELNPGTEILFTDNGYERGAAANVQTRRHGSGEGVIKLTWNGAAALPKGTVTEWKPCESGAPTVDWTYTVVDGSSFDLANAGDELFMMQGTWNTSTDSLTGRYIFAGSTWNGWTAVSSAVPNQASGIGQSRLPIGLECLNLQVNFVGGGEGRYKATETYTGTQTALLGYVVNDNTRWDAGAGTYAKPNDFNVTGLGGVIGNWNGGTDTRWFNGCNWDLYRVPDSTMNVTFSVSNLVNANNIALLPNETANCKDLTISGGSGPNSVRKIVGESNATKILAIHGNLVFNGQNALDFDDGNAGIPDGTIKVKGNWVNQGSETDFHEGNSTVVLNGSSSQNISISSGDNENFYNITFDNSANFSLSDSISVSGTLALVRGVVTTNGNTVSVVNSSESAITDGSANVSYSSTSSWINGNLNRSISTIGSYYMYPVGSATQYQLAGIKINSHTGLSRVNMSYTVGAPDSVNLASPFSESGAYFTKLLQDGKWTTATNAGLGSVNYDLELFPSFDWANSCGSNVSCAAYTIVKRTNGSNPWDNGSSAAAFTGGYAGDGRENTSGGIRRTGYTSFSEEGIAGSETQPFPIELLNFSGLYLGNNVAALNWKTTANSSAKLFYVEKSTDAANFVMIGYVSSSISGRYDFKDLNMANDRVYYRLRMIDNDGSFVFSPIVELTKTAAEEAAYLFPNPIRNGQQLSLFMRSTQVQNVVVEIYNTLGQVIVNEHFNVNIGNGNYVLNAELPSGIYCVKINGKALNTTQKFVVE